MAISTNIFYSSISIPTRSTITIEQARIMLDESIKNAIKLHGSMHDGTWKPEKHVVCVV
jgi:predicted acyltransferase (DUF342 family)